MSKIAYNKDKTKSVVLKFLKEFTIAENGSNQWCVKGWFNKENFFDFGCFESKDNAREFLETIHRMV